MDTIFSVAAATATTATLPAAITSDLDQPYPLDTDAIARFRRDGCVKLREVFAPATLAHFRSELNAAVLASPQAQVPLAQRSTYAKAFIQESNLWQRHQTARDFVLSAKLARLAAELMGVDGVRLYHDQALYKEAGGGFTPWHADQQYWPINSLHTVTAWVPLQAVPQAMGPLQFSLGSQRLDLGRELAIGDDSERMIGERVRLSDLPVDAGEFALGEISFHAGWTFHRAGPNQTATPRAVMTVIYLADGATLAQPRTDAHRSDQQMWLPDTTVGAPIQSWLNPLLWHRDGGHAGVRDRLPPLAPMMGTHAYA